VGGKLVEMGMGDGFGVGRYVIFVVLTWFPFVVVSL
jgi:hypothetical protein